MNGSTAKPSLPDVRECRLLLLDRRPSPCGDSGEQAWRRQASSPTEAPPHGPNRNRLGARATQHMIDGLNCASTPTWTSFWRTTSEVTHQQGTSKTSWSSGCCPLARLHLRNSRARRPLRALPGCAPHGPETPRRRRTKTMPPAATNRAMRPAGATHAGSTSPPASAGSAETNGRRAADAFRDPAEGEGDGDASAFSRWSRALWWAGCSRRLGSRCAAWGACAARGDGSAPAAEADGEEANVSVPVAELLSLAESASGLLPVL